MDITPLRAQSQIDRIGDRLSRVIESVLALAFIGAIGLNFADVLDRYLFGQSIRGADEVQIYIMVTMAFLGAAIVSWRNSHLRMDVLAQRLPQHLRSALRIAELVVLIVISGFVALQSAFYVAQMYALESTSTNAQIPMWIPHAAVAIGFTLIFLIALVRSLQRVLGASERARALKAEGPRERSLEVSNRSSERQRSLEPGEGAREP